MKQDILAHTGFCRRCKAPAGEKCEDFEMRGNKRREIYYCIRDCFDSDCNVFLV